MQTKPAPAAILPLLRVGTFGTHLLSNPAGSFSFAGTVPAQLSGKTFPTPEAGETAFVAWFRSMPVDEQRAHVGNLRNDIFVKVLAA